MRSFQMMVQSRVVRRAEIDPPYLRDDCEAIEADPESSCSLPPVTYDEQGWFTRFFRRWTDSPFMHERHTT